MECQDQLCVIKVCPALWGLIIRVRFEAIPRESAPHNAVCQGLTEQFSNIHSWGTYTGGFQSHIKLPALKILVLNTDWGY